MKLHFGKKESIYSIFKTIKKIPAYKTATLSFDADHQIFEHERRGAQLKDTIQQHGLQVTVQVTTQGMKTFFEKHDISTVFKHKHLVQKWMQQLHSFVFMTQKFHTNLIFKNSYVSYLVILSEITVIIFILYFFWGLISPNATISIQPSRHIETIVYNYEYVPLGEEQRSAGFGSSALRIPYYEGSIPFNHRLTLNVQNIEFSTTEAVGSVTFYNTTDESISLLPQTTLVTPDNMVFKTDARVTIPPGTQDDPGINTISVTAEAFTEKGLVIGEQGNIPKDTVLRIKNLPESMVQKSIYATATRGFAGGSTITKGSVLSDDIDLIEEKILSYMEDRKKEVLQSTVIEDELYILLYDSFINLIVEEFITTSRIGDSTSFIEGEIKAYITYRYVKKEDLVSAVDTYIRQRNSNNFTLLNYDFNSLTFYDIHKETQAGTIFIPTKINAIRGYNFIDDNNNIVPEMKAKIAGKGSQEVKKLLLEYEEIDDVQVSISPPWYDTLPEVISRISFRVFKD